MAHISRLPVEILSHIHQRLMDSATANPAATADPSATPPSPGRQHPLPTVAQQARRQLEIRTNFSATCRLFHSIDKDNLSIVPNTETGCLVTKNTIRNLAKLDKKDFTEHVKALFQDNRNIEVDFSSLSEKQTRIVLKLLVEQAKTTPLLHLRFTVDAGCQSPKMLGKINAAITLIRQSAPVPQSNSAASAVIEILLLHRICVA